jgi:hypothetical protein
MLQALLSLQQTVNATDGSTTANGATPGSQQIQGWHGHHHHHMDGGNSAGGGGPQGLLHLLAAADNGATGQNDRQR